MAAMRTRRETGFYATLNNLSSTDIFPNRPKRKKSRIYEVERLVDSRTCNGKTEYLVKYKGYSAYETSWEPAENITPDCIRLFEKPQPPPQVVEEASMTFRIALEQAMKSKSKLPVTIPFRGDVFRFLFKGKGDVAHEWHFLNKKDFTPKYFPEGWDIYLDSHGQGVKPYYPLRMRPFLSWSPKKYIYDNKRGTYIPAQRAFIERLTFKLVKVAAGDNN